MTGGAWLGIETATDRLSVALRDPNGHLHEAALAGARQHAGALVPLIDRLVREAGLAPVDLAGIAVADGPGSFTGLRVGAAVAKAMALAGAIPLYTAPSLLVRATGLAAEGETVLAVSSALRGELFAGAWHFTPGGSVTVRVAPCVIGPGGLAVLPPVDRVCGEGPEALLEAVARQLGHTVIGPPVALPSAAALLRLVGRHGGATRVASPAGWEPAYGRPAEAQAQWERRHGRPFPAPASDPR